MNVNPLIVLAIVSFTSIDVSFAGSGGYWTSYCMQTGNCVPFIVGVVIVLLIFVLTRRL
jgi:hypothetical protein